MDASNIPGRYKIPVRGYLICSEVGVTDYAEIAKILGHGEPFTKDIFDYLLEHSFISAAGAITSKGSELSESLKDKVPLGYQERVYNSVNFGVITGVKNKKRINMKKPDYPEEQIISALIIEDGGGDVLAKPEIAIDVPPPEIYEEIRRIEPKILPEIIASSEDVPNIGQSYEVKYGSLIMYHRDSYINIFEFKKDYFFHKAIKQKGYGLKIHPELYLLEIIKRSNPTKANLKRYFKSSPSSIDWQDALDVLETRGIIDGNEDVLTLSNVGMEMLSKIRNEFSLNMYIDEETNLSGVRRHIHSVSLDGVGMLNVPPPYFIAFKMKEYYESLKGNNTHTTFAFNPAQFAGSNKLVRSPVIARTAIEDKFSLPVVKNFNEHTTPSQTKNGACGLVKDRRMLFFIYPDNGDLKKQLIANDGKLLPKGHDILSALEEISTNGKSINPVLEYSLLKAGLVEGLDGQKKVTSDGEIILTRLKNLLAQKKIL